MSKPPAQIKARGWSHLLLIPTLTLVAYFQIPVVHFESIAAVGSNGLGHSYNVRLFVAAPSHPWRGLGKLGEGVGLGVGDECMVGWDLLLGEELGSWGWLRGPQIRDLEQGGGGIQGVGSTLGPLAHTRAVPACGGVGG